MSGEQEGNAVRLEERVVSLERQCTEYMMATTLYKFRIVQMSDFINYLLDDHRITIQELRLYVDTVHDAKKKLGRNYYRNRRSV